MTKQILKPCPFCGKEAVIYTKVYCGHDYYDVGCGTDNCIMREGSDRQYPVKARAINAWNKRGEG